MRVIVNPGTEPIEEETSIENALENMKQLVKDCGFSLDEITIFENKKAHEDGRYMFTLSRIGYDGAEIFMPGLPLEEVRFLGSEHGHNAWYFPRLYIDGSSFLWKSVVHLAGLQLNHRQGEPYED